MNSVSDSRSVLIERTPTGFQCNIPLASWGNAIVLLYMWLVYCGLIVAWHEGFLGPALTPANISIGIVSLGLLMILPLSSAAYRVFGQVEVVLDYPTLHVGNRLGPFRRHQQFDIIGIKGASVAHSWKHRGNAVFIWFREGENQTGKGMSTIVAANAADDVLRALAYAINTKVNGATWPHS